ncbi:MAG: cobalamin-dependent protein, partial [Oscillospiraceae bacterium]
MNILLVGISAKFIHSCLAVHLLQQYALEQYGIVCQTAEYTINQQEDLILSEIYKQHPDFIGFSCYIWNFEQIKSLLPNLKKVLPHTRILLGGPEVSFDEKEILQSTPADFVLSGEGEESFSLLCRALLEKTSLSDVPSLTYWEKNEIRKNPVGAALSLEKLPFVYQNFDDYQNKIIYYEAQRG